jgi:general secretion pathway protein E
MESQVGLPELLIQRQLISSDELERVSKLQDEQQAPLTRLVVELGLISEEDLLPVLRDHFSLPVMSLRDVPNTPLPIELPSGAEIFKLARWCR